MAVGVPSRLATPVLATGTLPVATNITLTSSSRSSRSGDKVKSGNKGGWPTESPFAPRKGVHQPCPEPCLCKDVRVTRDKAVSSGCSFVLILVGNAEQQETYAVHENILSTRSELFKLRLSSVPSEGKLKTLELADEDPEVFGLYVQLLYTGFIPSQHDGASNYDDYVRLCDLHILAYKYNDIAAQNDALDAIFMKAAPPPYNYVGEKRVHLLRCEHVTAMYENTFIQCKGRRLLVDLYTAYASKAELSDYEDQFPTRFMHDLALRMMGYRKSASMLWERTSVIMRSLSTKIRSSFACTSTSTESREAKRLRESFLRGN